MFKITHIFCGYVHHFNRTPTLVKSASLSYCLTFDTFCHTVPQEFYFKTEAFYRLLHDFPTYFLYLVFYVGSDFTVFGQKNSDKDE